MANMTVGELKKHLEQFPDDMEVLYCLYSDYSHMEVDDVYTVEAVEKGGYVMRGHATMSAENKAKAKTYLLFPGN